MEDEGANLTDHWTIVDGLPLFSRVAVEPANSEAVPLIYVHGFAISGAYLEPTAKRLAPFYPTYIPDLPGHGHSPKPNKTLTIPGLAHSLANYMDEMQVAKANFVGNSMGCQVIIELAHAYPARVGRAIIVSPIGGPQNQPVIRALIQLLRDSLREPPRMSAVAIRDYLRFGLRDSLRLMREMVKFPTVERMAELNVPTLIVAGGRDPLVSKEHLEQALSLPIDLTLVLLTGAAHAVNYNHPKQLACVIRDFIDGKPIDVERAGKEVVVLGVATRPQEDGQ